MKQLENSSEKPVFTAKKLTALEELSTTREAADLVPLLCEMGLSLSDAYPLAYNCARVYFALRSAHGFTAVFDVLSNLSLQEIAEICDKYNNCNNYNNCNSHENFINSGSGGYSDSDSDGEDDVECGFNQTFGEIKND